MATVKLADGAAIQAAVDAGSGQVGEKVTLGIRPEHLALGNGVDNTTKGKVLYLEHLGEASFIYLTVEGVDGHVVVRTEGDTATKMGDTVSITLPASSCHLFNSAHRAYPRIVSKAAETAPIV